MTSGGPTRVGVYGRRGRRSPLDPYKNLTTRVALYVLRCNDIQKFPTTASTSDGSTQPAQLKIAVNNEIPFGRGLRSSGAAVIAGVLLGSELGKFNLSTSRILDFALMVERHPDNVTAALVGGFVGSYLRELDAAATEAASVPLSEVLPEYPPDAGEDWGLNPPKPPVGIGHYVWFGWSESISVVVIIPRFELSTASARQVLPQSYSRKDPYVLLAKDLVHLLPLYFAVDSIGFLAGIQFTTSRCPRHRPRRKPSRPRTHLRNDEGPRTPTLP